VCLVYFTDWSLWTDWSECSSSCQHIVGVQQRTRFCLSTSCSGSDFEERACSQPVNSSCAGGLQTTVCVSLCSIINRLITAAAIDRSLFTVAMCSVQVAERKLWRTDANRIAPPQDLSSLCTSSCSCSCSKLIQNTSSLFIG